MNLTKEYLEELFSYKEGQLYWKVNKGTATAGSLASKKRPDGYARVGIDVNARVSKKTRWENGNGNEGLVGLVQ